MAALICGSLASQHISSATIFGWHSEGLWIISAAIGAVLGAIVDILVRSGDAIPKFGPDERKRRARAS